MVRKELYSKILGYNLIRKVIALVSCNFQLERPRKYSFKTALNVHVNFIKVMGSSGISFVLDLIKREILNFKYRREPRAIKKRKNGYPLLTTTRKESLKENWGYGRSRSGTTSKKKEVLR